MVSAHGYVITGGPGSGKTSLVDGLAQQGYTVFAEVSRRLIREQQRLPDGVLPWHNLERFATLALDAMLQQFSLANASHQPVFFDRAIPDIAGYLNCTKLPLGKALTAALKDCRYASPVFICAPWPAIYVNDPERPQTYAESVDLYSAIRHAYSQAGYRIVEVPTLPVADRVRFVLDTIIQPALTTAIIHDTARHMSQHED